MSDGYKEFMHLMQKIIANKLDLGIGQSVKKSAEPIEKRRDIVDFWWNRLDTWGRRRYLLWIDERPSLKTKKFYKLPKSIRTKLGKLMRYRQREGGTYLPRLGVSQLSDLEAIGKSEHTHIIYHEIFNIGDEIIAPHCEGKIVSMSLKHAEIATGDEVEHHALENCIRKDDAIEVFDGSLTSWDRLTSMERVSLLDDARIELPNIHATWSEMHKQHRDVIQSQIFKAGPFRPKPGEQPDAEGRYWRTLPGGHKIWYKAGDNMSRNAEEQGYTAPFNEPKVSYQSGTHNKVLGESFVKMIKDKLKTMGVGESSDQTALRFQLDKKFIKPKGLTNNEWFDALGDVISEHIGEQKPKVEEPKPEPKAEPKKKPKKKPKPKKEPKSKFKPKMDKNGFDISTGVKITVAKPKMSRRQSDMFKSYKLRIKDIERGIADGNDDYETQSELERYRSAVARIESDFSGGPDVEDMQTEWNKISPEYKKHIKTLSIKKLALGLGGYWEYAAQSVNVTTVKGSHSRAGTLLHEVAHSHWAFQPDKWEPFVVGMDEEGVGGVSSYSGDYEPPYGRHYKSFASSMKKNRRLILGLIEERRLNPEKFYMSMQAPSWKKHNAQWDLTPDDYVEGGKIQNYLDYNEAEAKYIYANEQHSEYMRIKYIDTHEQEGNENFQKLDRVVKKVFGEDYGPYTMKMLIKQIKHLYDT